MTINRIAAELKQQDYDAYLTSLLAESSIRHRLFAWHSLCHAITEVPYKTSTPETAALRLVWWRETLSDFKNGVVRQHPALLAAREQNLGSGNFLTRLELLIDGVQHAVDELQPKTFALLTERLDRVTNPRFLGITDIIGVPDSELFAVNVAREYALAKNLAELHASMIKGYLLLPEEWLEGVTLDRYGSEKFHQAIILASQKVLEHGGLKIPAPAKDKRKLKPLLAYRALAHRQIKQIKKCGGDVFDTNASISPLAKIWTIKSYWF